MATQSGLWTRGPEQGVKADTPDTIGACGNRLCVGALDGLWIFDGTAFDHRTHVAGDLPAEWVSAVAGDADGQVWAGTFDGGVALLGAHARRYSVADGLPDGRIQPHALAVVRDVAYAGTPSGLVRITGDRVSLVQGLGTEPVTAVAPAHDGGLWIGSNTTLRHITISEGESCARTGCG